MSRKKEYIVLAVLSILFSIIFCFTLNGKQNLAQDEVFTYGSSNQIGAKGIIIEDGVYEQGNTPFEKYVSVGENERFQYANAWKNQETDVHPPLYYLFIHTVCSLFPNTFSMWYAGIINLFFAIFIMWIVFFILKELGTSSEIALTICAAYTLTAGIYQANTFFRMYTMAMFFCTLLTYFQIRWFNKGFEGKTYIMIGITAIGGVLTHYYVIVFVVFQAIVMGVVFLQEKKYKSLLKYAITMILSAIMSIAIYPVMLNHIFGGYRGVEAFDNAGNMQDIGSRWKTFGSLVNEDVWGNGFFLIVIALVLLVFYHYRKKKEWSRRTFKAIMVIVIPSALYFLIISKTAVYLSNRYVFPVYALLLAVGYLIIWYAIKCVFRGKKRYIMFAGILTILLCSGFRNCPWIYSFNDDKSVEILQTAKKYKDKDCLFVYNQRATYEMMDSFFEIRKYSKVIFAEEDNLDILTTDYNSSPQELIVYVHKRCDTEQVLETVQKDFPQLQNIINIPARRAFTTAYYLSD